MVGLYRCPRCGSVGSIEFDMCQVCLYDYAGSDNREFTENGYFAIEAVFAGREEKADRHADPDLMMAGV